MTLAADHSGPTIHTLFCGFGRVSASAAARLLRAGQPPSSIKILDGGLDACEGAARLGLDAQPWRGGDLEGLGCHLGASITRIIVELADETFVEPLVRVARRHCPFAQIIVVLRNRDRAEAVLASGASRIVDEAAIAGALLAAASLGPRIPLAGSCH